jgi:hypothetical protein
MTPWRYKKMNKFSIRPALETFGNIRHDRNGSACDLIDQSKVPRKGPITGELIDSICQLPRSLENIKVFESSNFHLRVISKLLGKNHKGRRSELPLAESGELHGTNSSTLQLFNLLTL